MEFNLKVGNTIKSAKTEALFVITKITDKRVSYRPIEGKGYKANYNTISVFWISVKDANKYLESKHWTVVEELTEQKIRTKIINALNS